jgi:hypothetical protein
MNPIEALMNGLTLARNRHGIAVAKLHYSADPDKGRGRKALRA